MLVSLNVGSLMPDHGCWDFHGQTSQGLTGNGLKKRKHPVSGRSAGRNVMLMPEVGGGWLDWFEMIQRQHLLRLLQDTAKVRGGTFLNVQLVESGSRWATATEDCPVSKEQETEGPIHKDSSKLDNKKFKKMSLV